MNLLIYLLLLSVVIFYAYMLGIKKRQLQKKYRKQWQDIKRGFTFSTPADEMTLYRLYCDTLPRHWFIGRIL